MVNRTESHILSELFSYPDRYTYDPVYINDGADLPPKPEPVAALGFAMSRQKSDVDSSQYSPRYESILLSEEPEAQAAMHDAMRKGYAAMLGQASIDSQKHNELMPFRDAFFKHVSDEYAGGDRLFGAVGLVESPVGDKYLPVIIAPEEFESLAYDWADYMRIASMYIGNQTYPPKEVINSASHLLEAVHDNTEILARIVSSGIASVMLRDTPQGSWDVPSAALEPRILQSVPDLLQENTVRPETRVSAAA